MGKPHKKLWLLAVLALLVACFAVAGCGGDDEKSSSGGSSTAESSGGAEKPAEKQKVTMMLPFKESIAFIGLVIAMDRYYEELGLEVELPATDGDSFVVQQLVAGKEKFGLSAAPENMIAQGKGEDLVGYASVNNDIFTIVAPADSEVKSFDQMQGKKLGITNLGGGEIPLVKGALKNAGFEENKDVELVVIGEGGPAVASGLKKGTIDAYAGAINDIAAIQASGTVGELVPILSDEYKKLPSNELSAMREVLDNPEDREILIKLAKGWRMGSEFARENPEEALKIACERVPEDCQNMDVAKAYLAVAIQAETPPGEWGAHTPDKFTVVKDSIAAAQIEGDVDLAKAFTDDLLAEINAP